MDELYVNKIYNIMYNIYKNNTENINKYNDILLLYNTIILYTYNIKVILLAAYCEYKLGIRYHSVSKLIISVKLIDTIIDILNNSNKDTNYFILLKIKIILKINQLQPVCAA